MHAAEFTQLPPFFDFWGVLIFLGVVQGLFLAINCFFIRQRNHLSHHLLGWLLVSVSLTVIEVLLCYSNYIGYVPFLVSFSEPFNFVFPPLLYFYTLTLARPDFRWKARYGWVFLPAFLHAIYLIPFFAQSNAWLLQTVAMSYHKAYRIEAVFRDHWWASSYQGFYPAFKFILIGYQIIYLLLTLRTIHEYKRKKGTASSLQWVGQLSWSFLVVLMAYALLTWYYQSDVGDVYVAACVSLVCYGMSFRLITQSKILEYRPVSDLPVAPSRVKYEKTALDADTSTQNLHRLLNYMEVDKPYRRSDLTLPELASEVTIAPHHLSQVINQHCQQNFFDFINTYRVREIQQKLLTPRYGHLKIEEIAFESGFNSKSAFNAAFKKITRLTPSQYRKARQAC